MLSSRRLPLSFPLIRNLLYSLPGKTPQFSILRFSQEAALHCNVTSRVVKHNSAEKEVLCHSTRNQSLSLILRAIRSAERLVCFGLDLFENYPSDGKWSWLTQNRQWAWTHTGGKNCHQSVPSCLNPLQILKHNWPSEWPHPNPLLTQHTTVLERLNLNIIQQTKDWSSHFIVACIPMIPHCSNN